MIVGGPQTGQSPACPQNACPLPDHLNMSDADIIIQSCDLVNFRVHKLVLSLSSPFLSDMFSLPQPSNNEVVDGLPVVRLSEDAELLNSLLTILYPIPSVIPNAYDKCLMVLNASQKYDMVGVPARIRAEIQSKKVPMPIGASAFRAYAIASRGDLPSERKTLAHLTLDFPMTFEYIGDELPFFEGWALRDLIGFRKRCRDNLVSCIQSFHLSEPPFNIWMPCTSSTRHSSYQTGYSPSWLTNLFQQRITELGQAFTNPLPNPSNIHDEYLSALHAHIDSHSCVSCMRVHTLKGETFCKELENRLALAISEVGN
jgi:hypothetical protein